jgi:benzoate membrane transport protein
VIRRLIKDASISGLTAGFIVTLVGMTSSAILVFQAALAAGVSSQDASSWLGSLCVVVGVLTIALSVYYRAPVLLAWSTSGAALLTTGLVGVPLSDAIGAFVFSAALIFLCGITEVFAKIMNRIPLTLTAALLAGVLLHFALDAFAAFKTQSLLIGFMFLAFLLSKKFWPRMTMLAVLITGTLVAGMTGILHVDQIEFSLTHFQFIVPTFSIPVLLGVGLPLFTVTMASQNLTGITVMRANDYDTPISPILTWTGLGNLITAPFGGFAINLAAITAAIAMGPESHPRRDRRYFTAVVSGVIYIIIGLFAGAVTSVFAAFPAEMVVGIAGLALLGTIGISLQSALVHDPAERDAAFLTFVVTASGLSIFGVGSAFWGLIVGVAALLLFKSPEGKKRS